MRRRKLLHWLPVIGTFLTVALNSFAAIADTSTPTHVTLDFTFESDLIAHARPRPLGGELGVNRGAWEFRLGWAAAVTVSSPEDKQEHAGAFYRGLIRWYGASMHIHSLINRNRQYKIATAFVESGLGLETQRMGSLRNRRVEVVFGTGVAAQTPYGMRLTIGLRHRVGRKTDIDRAWTPPGEFVFQSTTMYLAIGASY